MQLDLLGRQLHAKYRSGITPLVVSHPVLVGILGGRENLIYQHGELVAPGESVVRGSSLVCVPTEKVADCFICGGYDHRKLLITGLCIEPPLVRSATDMFSRRAARIDGAQEVRGGFFSSGAEPKAHVEYLARAALSVSQGGGGVVVVAAEGGRLESLCRRLFDAHRLPVAIVTNESVVPRELPKNVLVLYSSRRDLNTLTALIFDQLDYFVAPAHERVNWAIGLGLPMIALEPTTGPFAPLNLKLVTEAGVAISSSNVGDSSAFHAKVNRLRRDGRLMKMSQAGWGKHPITGFDAIAAELVSRCSAS